MVEVEDSITKHNFWYLSYQRIFIVNAVLVFCTTIYIERTAGVVLVSFFGELAVETVTSTQVKIMIVSVCRGGEAKEAILVLETQIDITQLNFILSVFYVIE